MSRTLLCLAGGVAATASLVLIATASLLADSKVPLELREVRSKVEVALASYQSAVCTFSIEEDFPESGEWDALKFEGSPQCRWARVGKKERVEIDARKIPGRDSWYRVRVGFDDGIVTRVDFDANDPAVVLGVVKSGDIAQFDRQFSPAHFLGLRIFEFDETLLSLLAKPNIEFVAWEMLDGDRCAHLRVKGIKNREGLTSDCDFWLSATLDFLPRQIVSESRLDDGTISIKDTYRVTEFQNVSEPGASVPVPFPRKAKNTGRGPSRTFTFENVKLGADVMAEEVRLQFDKGTTISEALPGQPGRRHVFGVDSEQQLRGALLQAVTTNRKNGPRPDATPTTSGLGNVAAWGAAIILSIASFVVWLRSGA